MDGRVKNRGVVSPCFCQWSKIALLRNEHDNHQDVGCHQTNWPAIAGLFHLSMDRLNELLKKARVLPLMPRLVPEGESLYLVGGAVRDSLMGRESRDFDFTASFDPTALAQEFARQTAGTWFWLDQERQQSRVVRKLPSGPVFYDFAPFRAPTLDEDLAERDYTLNAIACPIPPLPTDLLHDPLFGEEALRHRLLVTCGPEVLTDDPLRVLRGVRYALTLDCCPTPETLMEMHKAAHRLGEVPIERVSQELLICWNSGQFKDFLALLVEIGALSQVFSQPLTKQALDKSLNVLEGAQRELFNLTRQRQGRQVAKILSEPWQHQCTTETLLLLALFLGAVGIKRPEEVLRRYWGLGKGPAAFARDLLSQTPEVWDNLKHLTRTPRARALWVEQLGTAPEGKLLWHLMLNPNDVVGKRMALEALHEWPRMNRNGRVPDLVSGQWLQQVVRIKPGPKVGALLQKVKQEEMIGRIRSPEEARAYCLGKNL